MNEFTKYELQSLLWAVKYVREKTNNCGDTMRSLERKLPVMIELFDEPDEELEKRLIRIESKLSELSIRIDAVKSLVLNPSKRYMEGYLPNPKEMLDSPQCTHESDGKGYTTGGASGPWYERCLKCGEFYR